jgi:hypothetical protein
VGSPPEKTTPLIANSDPWIISTISAIPRSSVPETMEEFWQYVQRTGHPRKKTVQTDLPRQSTVESGTKPPKFSLIGSPCRIVLVQRLFESIEL